MPDLDSSDTIGVLRLNHMQEPFDNPAILRLLPGALDQSACMTAVAGDESALSPFKVNADRRRRLSRQHRATNSAAYHATLRQRGSLTAWFN